MGLKRNNNTQKDKDRQGILYVYQQTINKVIITDVLGTDSEITVQRTHL